MNTKTIFLCHANEDKEKVVEVYSWLKEMGYTPWLDKIDLLPGQIWEQVIPKVIRQSSYIFIFFSETSVSKRGYVQKEFSLALDVLDTIPENQLFIIPIRLDDCDIPEKFKKLQYCDLFEIDGQEKILKALKHSDRFKKILLNSSRKKIKKFKVQSDLTLNKEINTLDLKHKTKEKITKYKITNIFNNWKKIGLVIFILALLSTIILFKDTLFSKYNSIFIKTIPDNASVYLNGIKKGLTPIKLESLIDGSYFISITKKGYSIEEREVRVSGGDKQDIIIELSYLYASHPTSIDGSLLLKGEPAATITVNKKRVAVMDKNSVSVPVKINTECEVVFAHSIYGAKTITTIVPPNGVKKITCYFLHEIKLRTSNNESVLVEMSGDKTETLEIPTQLLLGPGTYNFTIKSNNYKTDVIENTIKITPDTTFHSFPLVFHPMDENNWLKKLRILFTNFKEKT